MDTVLIVAAVGAGVLVAARVHTRHLRDQLKQGRRGTPHYRARNKSTH